MDTYEDALDNTELDEECSITKVEFTGNRRVHPPTEHSEELTAADLQFYQRFQFPAFKQEDEDYESLITARENESHSAVSVSAPEDNSSGPNEPDSDEWAECKTEAINNTDAPAGTLQNDGREAQELRENLPNCTHF